MFGRAAGSIFTTIFCTVRESTLTRKALYHGGILSFNAKLSVDHHHGTKFREPEALDCQDRCSEI